MKSVYISELILIKRVPLKNVMSQIEMCFYVNMQILKPCFEKSGAILHLGCPSFRASFRHYICHSVIILFLLNILRTN